MIQKVIPMSLFILLIAKITYNLITAFDPLVRLKFLGRGFSILIASEKHTDSLDGFKINQIKRANSTFSKETPNFKIKRS